MKPLAILRQASPLPPAPPKSLPKAIHFWPQFQHVIFHRESARSVQMDPNRDPVWKLKSGEIVKKCNVDCNTKKQTPRMLRNGCKNDGSADPKSNISLRKFCIFAVLQHHQKTCATCSQTDPQITPESLQFGAGGSPKAMQKT